MNGVKKGAFDATEAKRGFDIWINEKTAKIKGKKSKLSQMAQAELNTRVADETKKAKAMSEKLSAKLAEATAVAEAAAAPAVEAAAEAAADAPADAAPEAPAAE